MIFNLDRVNRTCYVGIPHHDKGKVSMTTNRKNTFALVLLAATAAFSTASISTVYFDTVRTSSLVCQQDSSSSGSLNYSSTGIVNDSKNKNATANCPVSLGPAEGTYQINTVAFANAKSSGGDIDCALIELESFSGSIVRIYPNSASISENSTVLLTWRDIEASAAESVFTLSCGLLPNTGLISISVSEEVQ